MNDADSKLVDLLKRAAAVVDAAGLPDDLHTGAFRVVADNLADGAEPGASKGPKIVAPAQNSPARQNGNGQLAAIASKLQLETAQVEKVFDVDDEGVHLTVSRAALDKSKQNAMREVAQLVGAARQALGEEWTPLNDLRTVADGRGVLNVKNWAAAVKALDGNGFRFKGSAKAQEIKINQVGYEAAAALVTRLTSGD